MIQRSLVVSLLGAALAAAATPAYANQDAVQFGTNIHVAREATVHDAVCFFCSVNVEGEVQDGVSIRQDLVSFFGVIRLGENVSVGKDMVAMFGSVHAPESVTVGKDRVVQSSWILFGPLILVGLIVILIVYEYRAYRRRLLLRGYHLPPN